MARAGWGTSNYLSAAAAGVTAAPLTMAAWFNVSAAQGGTNDRAIMGLHNSSVASNRNTLHLQLPQTATGGSVGAYTSDGSGTVNALASGTYTQNAWQHGAAVFTSAASRAAFLNGANKGTNATSKTPSGIDTSVVGVVYGSSGAGGSLLANGGTGSIAEAAIWNIALSDAEIAALALGLSPLRMHPEALVDYWPIVGASAPEINFRSNPRALTLNGTLAQSVHPRIYAPS